MSGLLHGDLNDQYLNKIYDDFMKEQQRLQSELKGLSYEDISKEKDIQKQLSLVSRVIMNIVSLKHLKMKINQKL